MISMYKKQEIVIQSYREGKSQRTISRNLSISRPTVRKFIEEYECGVKQSDSTQDALSGYLSQPATYKLGKRSKLKLTQEVQDGIDKYLEELYYFKRKSIFERQVSKLNGIIQNKKTLEKNQVCLRRSFYQRAKNKEVDTLFFFKTCLVFTSSTMALAILDNPFND